MNAGSKFRFVCFLLATVFYSHAINSKNAEGDLAVENDSVLNHSESGEPPYPDNSKKYTIRLLHGNNQILLNTISPHQITSLHMNPLGGVNHPGIHVSYFKEEENLDDGVVTIQPFFKVGMNYFYVRGGINFYYIINPDDAPGKMILPCIEFGFGILDTIYLSAGYLNDLFYGMKSIQLHYIFKDHVSSLVIGQAFGDDGEYEGLTYQIDFNVRRKFILSVKGNANFTENMYGQQFGVGMVF